MRFEYSNRRGEEANCGEVEVGEEDINGCREAGDEAEGGYQQQHRGLLGVNAESAYADGDSLHENLLRARQVQQLHYRFEPHVLRVRGGRPQAGGGENHAWCALAIQASLDGGGADFQHECTALKLHAAKKKAAPTHQLPIRSISVINSLELLRVALGPLGVHEEALPRICVCEASVNAGAGPIS
jgi:hypothetical protein